MATDCLGSTHTDRAFRQRRHSMPALAETSRLRTRMLNVQNPLRLRGDSRTDLHKTLHGTPVAAAGVRCCALGE
jgi:hypothetical protein